MTDELLSQFTPVLKLMSFAEFPAGKVFRALRNEISDFMIEGAPKTTRKFINQLSGALKPKYGFIRNPRKGVGLSQWPSNHPMTGLSREHLQKRWKGLLSQNGTATAHHQKQDDAVARGPRPKPAPEQGRGPNQEIRTQPMSEQSPKRQTKRVRPAEQTRQPRPEQKTCQEPAEASGVRAKARKRRRILEEMLVAAEGWVPKSWLYNGYLELFVGPVVIETPMSPDLLEPASIARPSRYQEYAEIQQAIIHHRSHWQTFLAGFLQRFSGKARQVLLRLLLYEENQVTAAKIAGTTSQYAGKVLRKASEAFSRLLPLNHLEMAAFKSFLQEYLAEVEKRECPESL